MALRKLFFLFTILLCQLLWAQQDSVAVLNELVISDTQLRDFSTSQSVQRLTDSVTLRSGSSLTDLLRYNTAIYFKENGLGMVASPSFRGTTAQQTAVLWNGININSQLNGQTDFNTINALDFNEVDVRAGGGSVIYGSSAIGGTIHLNNLLSFTDTIVNSFYGNYGSYGTVGGGYRLNASNRKVSFEMNVNRNSSDNDYPYPKTDQHNQNGQYYNQSANAAIAFKANDNNIFRLYTYLYDSERHFSGTLSAPSLSKYHDHNARALAEWDGYYGRFTSKVKVAVLNEHYRYYARYTNPNYTYGKVNTMIGKYDATYHFPEGVTLNSIVDVTHNDGEGSDISKTSRTIFSGNLLLRHRLTNKFNYEAGIRQEVTDLYKSPLLFSAGASYGVTNWYTLKLNASRNFRIPTFNDLYWTGSGNPDLKPESSYQAELGNVFEANSYKLTLTGYYIKIRDMIRWTPTGGSLWQPENVGRVNTYGLEVLFNKTFYVGESRIAIDGTYAYTKAKDDDTGHGLIYVPNHKATAAVAFQYKRISAYYRQLFNGSVYTLSDNSANLPEYSVSAIGAEYRLPVLKDLLAGFRVNNLWNEAYANVAMRPMPGRNYTMYLNFKF